jgi:hypothetical protein
MSTDRRRLAPASFCCSVWADGAGVRHLLHLMEEPVLYLESGVYRLNNLAVIGATTDAGKLSDAILHRFEIKPFSQPYSLSELAEARHRPYEFDVSSYSVQGIESAQPGRIAAAIRPAGGTAGGLNRPALTSQPLCSFMRTYRRVALLAQTATHGAPTDAAGGEHAPTTSDGEVWWS